MAEVKAEILAKLQDIANDSGLTDAVDGKTVIDLDHVNSMYPGFVEELTNTIVDSATGAVDYDNVRTIRDAGYHAYAMPRSGAGGVIGRVRTPKGMIPIE